MANYVTVATVCSVIEKTLNDDDEQMNLIIESVSRAIDNYCNRPDGFVASATATARLFSGSGSGVITIDDAVVVTLVEAKGSPTDSTYTAWAASDWQAFHGDPKFPDFNRTPYNGLMLTAASAYSHFPSGRFISRSGFRPLDGVSERGTPTIRVTARWGYALTVPPAVRQAALIQTARLYKRGQGAYNDSVASPDFGQMMYRGLDPDVQFILRDGRLIQPALA